jgi:hypothetical protein
MRTMKVVHTTSGNVATPVLYCVSCANCLAFDWKPAPKRQPPSLKAYLLPYAPTGS